MTNWKLAGLALIAPLAFAGYLTFSSVFMKPAALLDKATNTTQMLANYEWFYEAANTYKARVAQIAGHKELVAAETDKGELSRLRVDMSTMKMSCRELAAKYNAQSEKIHVGYLKSKSLPDSLDIKGCE